MFCCVALCCVVLLVVSFEGTGGVVVVRGGLFVDSTQLYSVVILSGCLFSYFSGSTYRAGPSTAVVSPFVFCRYPFPQVSSRTCSCCAGVSDCHGMANAGFHHVEFDSFSSL